MEKGFNVPFRLFRIHTTQYAIFEKVVIEEESIDLETGMTFGVDLPKNVISVGAKFKFDSSSSTFLMIEVGCEFNIDPEALNEFVQEDKKLVIPKALISHLSVITIGTARGALHAKTEGTSYNKYVIPTINVTDLVPEDLSFDIEENSNEDQVVSS